jgi:hypothetical protein
METSKTEGKSGAMTERVRKDTIQDSKGKFLTRPPTSGRKAGQPNKTTRILKEAIILAAEKVGSDKRGTDGLVGYLVNIAKTRPEEFCALLGKVLPLQLTGPNDGPLQVAMTRDEVRERLQERGIPITGVFDGPAEIIPPPQTAKMQQTNGSGRGTQH